MGVKLGLKARNWEEKHSFGHIYLLKGVVQKRAFCKVLLLHLTKSLGEFIQNPISAHLIHLNIGNNQRPHLLVEASHQLRAHH